MWKCELCSKMFDKKTMAIELKFGYVDCKEAKEKGGQCHAFYTEDAVGPICDDCGIAYIKGEKNAPAV